MNYRPHTGQQPPCTYRAVGIMSGTSLDGLDLCLCSFVYESEKWKYSIEKTNTVPYPDDIREKLTSAFHYSARAITQLDFDYGRWIGRQVRNFLAGASLKPDFIASHGHTIFHDPSKGYTLQIGKGSSIAAETGIPCISDFRSPDVSRGGQGAPLVPIGDRLLFAEYDICLNLGGIANISYEDEGQRIAFDIAPCNMLLNHLASKLGEDFDHEGKIGNKGTLNKTILRQLDSLDFYAQKPPKSLGREWFESLVLPIIQESSDGIEDTLRTSYEHITNQISSITNTLAGHRILATGGGAKNTFLIHLLQNKSKHSIVIPDEKTIDYKEAMIFAFLGVLYMGKKIGALASVTGAAKDSISGCLYY